MIDLAFFYTVAPNIVITSSTIGGYLDYFLSSSISDSIMSGTASSSETSVHSVTVPGTPLPVFTLPAITSTTATAERTKVSVPIQTKSTGAEGSVSITTAETHQPTSVSLKTSLSSGMDNYRDQSNEHCTHLHIFMNIFIAETAKALVPTQTKSTMAHEISMSEHASLDLSISSTDLEHHTESYTVKTQHHTSISTHEKFSSGMHI